jgi:hypothetical protein
VPLPESRSKTFRKLGHRSGISILDTHGFSNLDTHDAQPSLAPAIRDPGFRSWTPTTAGTSDPRPLARTRKLDLGHPCARVSVGGAAIVVGLEPVHPGSQTKAARHLSFLDTHTFRSWTPKAFVPGHPRVSARPPGSGIWSRAQPTPPNPASCGRPDVGAALWWVSRTPVAAPYGCPEVASRSRDPRDGMESVFQSGHSGVFRERFECRCERRRRTLGSGFRWSS